MNHVFRRFRRDITGLIWLATGIFLAFALLSFSPLDPSFNTLGKGLTVRNYCGYFGSFLADLLYQGLGLSAWLLPLASLRVSWARFQGKDPLPGGWRWITALLLLLTASSLTSLYFAKTRLFSGHIFAGGWIGAVITKSLIGVFNPVGVAVILWTLAAVLLVFYTERSLQEIFAWPIALASGAWQRARAAIATAASSVSEAVRALLERSEPVPVAAPSRPASAPAESAKGLFRLRRGDEKKPSASEGRLEKMADRFFPIEPAPESVPEPVIAPTPIAEPSVTPEGRRRVSLKKKVERRVENWELPKISLLEDPPLSRAKVDEKEIRQKAALLTNKLEQFSVRGKVVGVKPGPAVTMFEFKPNVDVKISRITDLADDLSLALSSESVRIIAPIPGRDVVGIETSNSIRETVYLKDILADEQFWEDDMKLPVALGQQADGLPKVVDLRKMPHLLVAGSTGSGKSVFTVSTLTGFIFRHSPKTLKLILVDPKQVDLAAFNDLPHLLMPPIREAKKAISALRWAIREMEKRYRSMSKFGARGLEGFNEIVSQLSAKDIAEHEKIHEEMPGAGELDSYYFTPQPYIVIVVEEFGDLMAVDKANVEQAVVRLAQMARACGIHLILAMQSPRKDVVTGLIKTNIPGRVSFKVASKMDSRIILDESGAERLLTRGDMLFLAPGVSKPARHHGPWLSDQEINSVVRFWKDQGEPQYDTLALRALEGSGGGYDLPDAGSGGDFGEGDGFDEKYDEVLAYVSTLKEVSASLLQRKFRLGYPRAARMIEIFEAQGVVGPAVGSKPRQVLVNELK